MENEKVYTYLMFDGMYYKIGKSGDPKKRLSSIRTANPNTILLMYSENIKEKELQLIYESKRLAGEWFDLKKEDIDNIKKLMGNLEYYNNEVILDKIDILDDKKYEFEKIKIKREKEHSMLLETSEYYIEQVNKIYNIKITTSETNKIILGKMINKYGLEFTIDHSEKFLKEKAIKTLNVNKKYDWVKALDTYLHCFKNPSYKTEISYIIGISRNKFSQTNPKTLAILLEQLYDIKKENDSIKNMLVKNEFNCYRAFIDYLNKTIDENR